MKKLGQGKITTEGRAQDERSGEERRGGGLQIPEVINNKTSVFKDTNDDLGQTISSSS